jgi:hypothetical protein
MYAIKHTEFFARSSKSSPVTINGNRLLVFNSLGEARRWIGEYTYPRATDKGVYVMKDGQVDFKYGVIDLKKPRNKEWLAKHGF